MKRARLAALKFIPFPIFVLALVATGYFALQLRRAAPAPLAGPLLADKGYGVTLDLTQYKAETLPKILATLRQNGLTWLRQPLTWAELEPAPGEFVWSQLDPVFAAIAQANETTPADSQKFELIVVLQTSPTWTRPPDTPLTTPPGEVADFGNFARALAERYGNQLIYYQIWHEPNLSATWGNTFVDPAAYADLLREAALNIRAADPTTYILSAALAPTLENGPLNLNEISYLDQLYQAKGNRWFDIVAGQPYGFASEPSDPADPEALNFRRLELLRAVMLQHDQAETPIWATAFGWNALPNNWGGRPAPWKSDTSEVQTQRTTLALRQVRREWPWLGPLLALRWDTTGLAEDDPARGFALTETPTILQALQTASTQQTMATAGNYPATHPTGQYSSAWRFALTQADIPRHEPRTLTISFEGTRLDLTINRGPYRGYLWVTIDGQPANALPQDNQGRSYVVLYDPLRESEQVTLAHQLPPGPHQALIVAEGGWGQWAVSGWQVYNEADLRSARVRVGLTIAGLLAIVTGLGLGWQIIQHLPTLLKQTWAWGEIVIALYARLHEPGHLLLTFGLALAFYLAPGFIALLLLPFLALTILFRPDLGLALIVFSLSFFQISKELPLGTFSPVELTLLLTLAGFIFRGFLALGRTFYASPETTPASPAPPKKLPITNYQLLITPQSLKSTDWAALALVVLALIATFAAQNFGVSMHEWRVVVCESMLFYFLVRLGIDFGLPERPRWCWAWRLVDAFVAGATLQALIALYLYFFTDQSITAEGVRRALGLAYGSPNNLSLFLGRAGPILLAVALVPGSPKLRRGLYGVGWLVVSLALYLTFSKGALLLGLPAGLVGMALLYALRGRGQQWRRGLAIAMGGLLLLGVTLVPVSQTERFRTTFDLTPGSTGFFRLKLWEASLTMLGDHWLVGVGLDNFLYHYRTRYILPEAWPEPNLSHPHNLFLDFGTRLGIGGIFILLWLQIAFWRNAWRLYQSSASPLILGLLGSMVIFLSHGLVDNSYFLVDLAFAFFLNVGLVQRLGEEGWRGRGVEDW